MNYTSTMQFIDMFRRNRALWDRTDVDYLNKEARQRQREMIGYTLGMTEVDVGKKISNLRTYYIREMVKRDKAIMQGHITPETYQPRWPYFDALDAFLGDVVRKKRNDALMASGIAPDLHFMYVEEQQLHNSDSDNDNEDFNKIDDSHDISRDSTGSGGASNITSPATTTGGDNTSATPPLKRAKTEPGTLPDCQESVELATSESNRQHSADSHRQSAGNAESSRPNVGSSTHQYGTPFQSNQNFLHAQSASSSGPAVPLRPRGSWVATHTQQGFHGHSTGGFGAGGYGGGGIAGMSMNAQANQNLNTHESGGGGTNFGPTNAPPGMVLVEEDDDWLFGRYIVRELKKVKSFKDKQLAKMKMTQIVTYAQLGMNEQSSSDADVSNS